ncbi:MAG: hypothetical protein HOM11_11010 [Methylococcales bacterium]|jgi:hypothetical protein|nr:hypothetical protein [Methylococcales bacterium]MBT7443327.1 hypothetical protein [Methylococcales bacterium]
MRVSLYLFMFVGFMLPFSAFASVITFENKVIDRLDLAGVQTEGDVSYQAFGEAFELTDRNQVSNSFLATRFNLENPVLGDHIDFTMSGHLFKFVQLDFASSPFNDTDDVTVRGFLNDTLVGEVLIDLDSPDRFEYLTALSTFSSPINLLSIEITRVGNGGGIRLDNIELISAVSLPSSLSMFGLGMLLFAARKRDKLVNSMTKEP